MMKRTKPAKNEVQKRRRRNVAHQWTDKRVNRFFRKHFSKKHYKNLRLIYSALCEIDSDFGEGVQICGLMKTIATYSGMNVDTIRPYVKALRKADIIDYWQDNDSGLFGPSNLILYEWDDERTPEVRQIIERTLQTRRSENPVTEKPGNGKTSHIKNNNILLLSTYKNSKESTSCDEEDEDENISEKKKEITPFKQMKDIDNKIVPSMFESFWNLYPKERHINKGRTLSIWNKLCKRKRKDRPTWNEIQTALQLQKKTPQWSDPKFIPHPSTWLNQNRWIDDPSQMKGSYANKESKQPEGPIKTPEDIIHSKFDKTRANAFLKDCYYQAEDLIDADSDKLQAELTYALINLYTYISEKQDFHFNSELRSLMLGPMDLVEKYIDWLEKNDWIQEKTIKVFQPSSRLFIKYLNWERNQDNMQRHPITGKSNLE